ncbi:hypothetical protein Tco_0017746 [Tanacetum coccineum]
MEITVVTLVEEKMSLWKGNLPSGTGRREVMAKFLEWSSGQATWSGGQDVGVVPKGLDVCLYSPFDLVAYTDSDYAGASLDRKSTTGGCQFLGCRLISWQCKKQMVVANSTIEAEYVAASSCYGQICLQKLLIYPSSSATYLFSNTAISNSVGYIVFGKLPAINGFGIPLPVAVCSGIANSSL